ncbi:SDR family oxidoreductase [Microbacterium sp. ISL-59]|uniref:SDR family oxidoreductase n=1 Tax=Microbacterium sp. ISL-59 TaxID=2819159 RepID=UPI001BEA96E0|nr:SDR family oxidoreductase [Microbacterium sp. ISL-59]MBT2496687.1 SDR family oxidoreductase [Microbacterium sp. ISL-59]
MHSASSLTGQRILVVGATGGIGTALCRDLSALSARFAVVGTRAEAVSALVSETGAEAGWAVDATDESQMEQLFAEVERVFGGLDVLINLVGYSVPHAVADLDAAGYERLMDVNVKSTFLSCHFALALFPETGGRIVNVGSMAGLRPNGVAPLYCAAKAAVAMFTDALAIQVADRGIQVSSVTPGGVDTGFWGDRPVDRGALLAAEDVAVALVNVLTQPSHVLTRNVVLESAARRS